MSTCNVQQLLQDGSCFLCVDAGIRQVLELQLLCEILNNGIGGGGGTGTVTSFSSSSLSPLFTTSVATATTTPALTFTLSTQTANTFFAGPTTGAAAAPTFRAMVNADLGTTLTPQFARLGIGVAADAAIPMLVHSAGGGQPAIKVNRNGDDPYISLTDGGVQGGYMQWVNGTNALVFRTLGTINQMTFFGATGILDVTTCFSVGGTPGATGSFDATNTVSVVGGIVVGWV